MHKNSVRMVTMLILSILIGLNVSCASAPKPVPEDASALKIIQMAQERYDAYDLDGAKYYYQVLLERYGSDPAYRLNAMYEIAFIEYKRGNTKAAIEGFRAVRARYEEPDGAQLPQTWKTLAEKMLSKLGS